MKNNYMNINFHGAHIINCPEVARTADKFIESAAGDLIHLDDTQDGNIAVTGWVKNLFDKSASPAKTYVSVDETATGIKVTSDGSSEWRAAGYYVAVPPHTDLTISCVVMSEDPNMCFMEVKQSDRTNFTVRKYIAGSGRKSLTFNTENNERIWISFFGNTNVLKPNTITFDDFMVEKGSVAHPYVPYSGYDITSCGKNLIPYPYTLYISPSSQTEIDVTENNGAIKITRKNGVAAITQQIYILLLQNADTTPYSKEQFSIRGNSDIPPSPECCLYIRQNGEGGAAVATSSDLDGLGRTFKFRSDCRSFNLAIKVSPGAVIPESGITFKPMLEIGDTATVYEPYSSSTIHVDNDTPAPVYGLRSFDGQTNIFNGYGAEMSVTYPLNESGRLIIDTAKNVYDKLTELATAIVVSGGED